MDAKQKQELNELLYLTLERSAQPWQTEKLNAILQSSPEALQYSLDFYLMSSALRKTNAIPHAFFGSKNEITEQFNLLHCLAVEERTAPSIKLSADKPNTHQPIIPAQPLEKKVRKINRFSLAVAAVSLAALLCMIAYVQVVPSREPAAVLIDAMDIKVKNTFKTLKKGDIFYNTDRPIALEQGIVNIQFGYGADVIIEAPCEFACKSNGTLELKSGKAFASVPPEAIGFIIETPSSRMIDLGTEFGVEVEPCGSSSINVFQGQTQLVSRSPSKQVKSVILTKNQSRKIDIQTGTIEECAFHERTFIQYFNSETKTILTRKYLCLADIVGGGNGTGNGQLNKGVDVLTGTVKLFTEAGGSQPGTREYLAVRENPFIDGVFVPDGGSGPVVVSSQGHRFENCPDTNGQFWGGIFNGGWHESTVSAIPRHPLRLDGIVYGTGIQPSIYIHANQGITFDLNALRSGFPKLAIYRFTALCGISDTLSDYADQLRAWKDNWTNLMPECSLADVYVLVDGQVRFAKKDLSVADAAAAIAVDIYPEDRFLTLVTTQGSDPWGNTNDWTLIAQPRLLLTELK
ncbi:MAG TPA: NPCBM/NEW2 domain-containing protein [Anaerohalosphaeraceae bacterium]|nr:NPCBM/NEW2 domain-containing protein [Anaerohalosphaeraceae bacterium]HOL32566.1 NPCBM/NEW2 domain-containing protein [Anaerohalosphaeraceae bacterium]HOM77331.1 NPCBM/NEW2 domain-containing protein [Anaerohalosphaeraceae bacterium]HPC65422.1 NPCBM/NEW2 domain-containing protein [Anaerohalosphaeraceae bacterium]HPO70862.1 NPCBM/NEW2 domain-containing protein [Anaerohalosphaeraceae bacterium]